jgi:hypothetical protein
MSLIPTFFIANGFKEKNINAESFYLEKWSWTFTRELCHYSIFLDVLDYIHKSKYSSEIKSSMPIVGIDGTP